jgi:hypothetical protein
MASSVRIRGSPRNEERHPMVFFFWVAETIDLLRTRNGTELVIYLLRMFVGCS